MTSARLRRIWYLVALLFGAAIIVSLVLYALRQNINLFYTPSELTTAKLPAQTRIRVGGMVRNGSIQQDQNLNTVFVITDYEEDLIVTYQGVLPDLFREGQGVVALGILDAQSGEFKAEQILAKHDEKYMPPELNAKLAPRSDVT